MALADLIAQETYRAAPGKLERVLTALPPKDADDLRAAIANEAIPAEAIARALKKLGHDIGGERIRIARREARQ
jgi:hypothetical protein